MSFDIGELQGTIEIGTDSLDASIQEALAKLASLGSAGAQAAAAAGKKIGAALTPDTSGIEKALAGIGKTLDQQTGAVTKNTRAWAANEIGTDKLRDLERLGIATKDYIDAITGVPGAQERMQRSLEGNADALRDLDRLTSQVAQAQQNFATEARAVGDAAEEAESGTEGFGDGLRGLSDGLDGVIDKVQEFASSGKAAAAVAGAAIGAGLALAIAAAFEADTVERKIKASLGATQDEAARIGKQAGSLFSKNYGESMDEVADALIAVQRNMKELGGVSDEVMEDITGQVISVSQAFDQDFNEVTRAAGVLMKTGLAANAQDALDIITAGFQRGVNVADDLLDTFTEYSTIFRSLGLDGKDALGLLSQGLQAGARDADVVADALKEMLLRIQSGDAAQAIQDLGLNFNATLTAIANGGEQAKTATDVIIDGLRNIKDPAEKSALAVGIFGTKAEDMQQAINGLDVSAAAEGFGNVAGAAQELDQTLGGSLQGAFDGVMRSMQGFITEAGVNLAPVITIAAGAFALLFDTLKGTLSWLGDLPVELYAVGAAVAVWASWTSIAAGAQALATGLLAASAAAKAFLVSIGPIGWAIAAAGAAWAIFESVGDDTEDMIQRQTDKMQALRDTLDQTTGAITDATRAEVVRQAQADGTLSLLEQLGVSTKLYTDASLGNADAQKEFTAALDKAGASGKTTAALFGDMADDIDKAGISQQELTDAINSGDWSGVTAKMQAYAEGVGRATGNTSDATAITTGFAAAMQNAQGPLGQLGLLYGQTQLTAQELGQAQADAAQRTSAMGESASAAYDRVLAMATVTGASADQIAQMGAEAGLSADQIKAIQDAAAGATEDVVPMTAALDAAGSAASELDSLVQFLAISLDKMNGGTISAEQAFRANEAALREQAAAVRDVAEAIADQDAKAKALTDATNQFGAGSAEAAAAQRDYDDAVDGVADAQDRQFDTAVKARDSALEMAAAAYRTAAANGDLEGAAAAATAIIEDQRRKFIAAQPEADRLSGKADQVAASLYGIPGAVATQISESGASNVQSQANNTTGAVNNIPGYKGITIDAGGNAQAVINGVSVSLQNMQSYKQIIVETIVRERKVAVNKGGQIGRVMGLPGFHSGGQVPGVPPLNPREDNVLALANGAVIALRSKEWIQPQEAVDHYGANFMRAVQTRAFPKPKGWAEGGPITPVPAASGVVGGKIVIRLEGGDALTGEIIRGAELVTTEAFEAFALELG